jgi:hypothetical protein
MNTSWSDSSTNDVEIQKEIPLVRFVPHKFINFINNIFQEGVFKIIYYKHF